MAEGERRLSGGAEYIDFRTEPGRYKHWRLTFDGPVATLAMNVDENGGLYEGYQLKLNSYDLSVDIELADALQRLRFEHPGVKVVLLRSAKERVFCAGANIRMLAGASHTHKVNFCKFTNETRNAMEEADEASGQKFVCVVNGSAAGGGYELALATGHIMLVDDGNSAVALPEVPLLAVLPGTGGLTRVIDKRKVRRDHADVFCTIEEGIKGRRAVQWRLVDELAPASKLEERVSARAKALADSSSRNGPDKGIALAPIERKADSSGLVYNLVTVEIDRAARIATITLKGPNADAPASADDIVSQGADFWLLKLGRELDDAILHLRNNEFEIGTLVFKTVGDADRVLAYDALIEANASHWLAHEIRHFWKRVLKRIDVTSRTLVASVEPGSCFVGTLAEIVFAADRGYMLVGQMQGDNRPPAEIVLNKSNFGAYPMSHGLTRLQSRFFGEPDRIGTLEGEIGKRYDGTDAEDAGLVTFGLDDIDWADEIRVFLEERAAFSPDSLVGMEANLRFAGPETMESKIFSRLTAWQNWIFQRPNAVGEEGALRRYGTGERPVYDMRRV